MASGREKKIASNNAQTLKELHLISLGINTIALLALFLLKRPSNKIPYFIFSIPAWFAQYTLEKSGRPIYEKDYNGNLKLLRSGNDIKGPGLFEYMFDVIYVTFLLDIIMICFGTNYGWWLYSVIPAYAGYKAFELIKPFISKAKTQKQSVTDEQTSSSKGPSKRQQKLKARSEKQQVRYR